MEHRSVRSSFDKTALSGILGDDCPESSRSQLSQPRTYTAERVIGNGSFGVVYQALSMDTGETVAIKKVYQDRRYKNRELQIMRDLGYHPNIVTLHHAFYTSGEKSDELFLNVVMEYLSDTVHRVMKTHLKSKTLIPLALVKLYVFQLARGLEYMHSCGICHRDIKPQNLLICGKTHVLKLCDFGSAKRLLPGESNVSYICSRYYRAPELIFGATNYGFSVDVWSMGCVFGELVTGAPLFPGENGIDQLVQIIKLLGTPTNDQLLAMNPNYTDFCFPEMKPVPEAWHRLVHKQRADPHLAPLLESVLRYEPQSRCSLGQFATSDFFAEKCEIDEISTRSGSLTDEAVAS